MRNKLISIVSVLVLLSMVLSACGGAATPTAAPAPTVAPAAPAAPEPTKAPEPTAAPAAPEPAAITVGQITDMGGIDDKSFNASAWKGVQDAEKDLGIVGKYLESQQQSDYAKNMQQFVSEKLDLIVPVGFVHAGPVDTATAG